MDIDLLRSFIAICEAKSFTAAARKVGRTQSAVSLQMKRLEGSLGRPLFQRGAPGVVLTQHGAMLVPKARRVLAAVSDTLAAFDKATVDGVFVIGMPDDYAPRILVPTLRAIGALFPLASVNLVIDESRTLVMRLAEGSVDLAFVTEEEGPNSGGPIAFVDEMVWVTARTGDAHLQDPLPLAVWDDDKDSYAKYMREHLEEAERQHRVAIFARSMTGLKAAVTSGLAISAIMRSSVTEEMRELTASDGFLPLGQLAVRLEKAHMKKSAVVDALAKAVLAAVIDDPRTAQELGV